MFKIQKLNKISQEKLDLMPTNLYDIGEGFDNPDGILVRSANMLESELPANLKGIARAGAGVNNIPLDRCSEKGIVVFNTPGANANGVKELVIASMLLASRKIHQGINWIQSNKGTGQDIPKLTEKGKANFDGPEIAGKKLGVIGLGAIGAMVANDAVALGMTVVGYDPYISVDAAWSLSSQVIKETNLDNLIATCDYITIHVPLLPQTKGLFNSEKFAIAKKGLKLINLARGGLVVNKDVIAAIEQGIVGCYVTDFPEEELLGVENIITVPHLGASTPESEENCATMAVNQLRIFLETGNIKNSVNFPEASLAYNGGTRLIVANKNIPNMVGQITTKLASNNINISDMLNKHRDNVGFNIIDIEGDITDAVIDDIKAIEGVTMVRVIK